MQTSWERPRLRRGLAATPDERNPECIVVWDPYRLSPVPQRVTVAEFCSVQGDWMKLKWSIGLIWSAIAVMAVLYSACVKALNAKTNSMPPRW